MLELVCLTRREQAAAYVAGVALAQRVVWLSLCVLGFLIECLIPSESRQAFVNREHKQQVRPGFRADSWGLKCQMGTWGPSVKVGTLEQLSAPTPNRPDSELTQLALEF